MGLTVHKCGGCVSAVRHFCKEEVKTSCAPCVPSTQCAPCAQPKCGSLSISKTLIDSCNVTGVTGLARIQTWDIKICNDSGAAVSGLNVLENFAGLALSAVVVESEVVGNFTSVSSDCSTISVNDFAAIVAGNGALVDPLASSIAACSCCHLTVRVGIADFRVGNDGTPATCSFSADGCNTVTVSGKTILTDKCGCTIECPVPAAHATGKDCCGNFPCHFSQVLA